MKTRLHFCLFTLFIFFIIKNVSAQTLTITNITAQAARCSANGSLNIGTQGGTPPLFYTLIGIARPTQNTPLFSNLPPATYTVQVSDANGSSTTASATVQNQYTLPLPPTVTISGNDVTVTANGGRPPFRYAYMPTTDTAIWTNGRLQSSPFFPCVPNGNWAFITYDSCGNFYPLNNIAIQNAPLPQGSCIANADGTTSITIPMATGAMPPYTFTCVSNFGVSLTNTTGVFPSRVGCSFVVSYTNRCGIAFPTQSFRCQTPIALGLQVRCFNYQTGAISVAACGGRSPYTYRYTNPQTGTTTTNTTGVFNVPPNTAPNISVTDMCLTLATARTEHINTHTAVHNLCLNDSIIRVNGSSGFTYNTGSIDTVGCAGSIYFDNNVSNSPHIIQLFAPNGSLIRRDTMLVAGITYNNITNFSTAMTITFQDACGVTDTIHPLGRYDTEVDARVLCANADMGEVTLEGFDGAQNQYEYIFNGSTSNTTGAQTGHFTGLPNDPEYEFYIIDPCGAAVIRIYNHVNAKLNYDCPYQDTLRMTNNTTLPFGYVYNSSRSGSHYYPNIPLAPAPVLTATVYTNNNVPIDTISYIAGQVQQPFLIPYFSPNVYVVFRNSCGTRDTVFADAQNAYLPVFVLCDTIRQAYNSNTVNINPATTTFNLFAVGNPIAIQTNNTGIFTNVPLGSYYMRCIFAGQCTTQSDVVQVFNAQKPHYTLRAHGINRTTYCQKGYLLKIDSLFQTPFTVRGATNSFYQANAFTFENLAPGKYYINNICVKDTIVLPELNYNLAVTTVNPVCGTQGVDVAVSGGNLTSYYTNLFNSEPTLAGNFTNLNTSDYYETYITTSAGATLIIGGGTGTSGQFVNLPEGASYTAYLFNAGAYPGQATNYTGQCPIDTVRFFAPYYQRPILTATYGIICASTNSSNLTATVLYGTAPFTFSIDAASVPAGYTGATTLISPTNSATFVGLPAGNYNLHVEDFCLISADYAAAVGTYTFSPTYTRYCNGQIALTLPLLSNATYNWINSNNNTIGTTATVFVQNTNAATYTVNVLTNGCNYTNTITTTPQTAANVTATAGADIVTSSNNSSLSANIPSLGATGTWSQISGAISTITNPNNPNTTVTLNGSNIYTYVWTVSNGAAGCIATDTMRIIYCSIISPAQANLAIVQPNCSRFGSLEVVLQIGTTATHSFTWSDGSHFATLNNLISGVYSVIITPNNACKTPITLTQTLVGFVSTQSTQNITQCGGNYVYNTHIYTQSGLYKDTIPNFNGCDSIVTTNLTINRYTTRNQSIVACDSFRVGTRLYAQSGIYLDTLLSPTQCDTILTTNLTIHNSIITLLTAITACDSLVYNTPTSTTFYRDTTLIRLAQTAQGCTNSIQQPIIIHYSRTDTLPSIIACDSIFIQGIMCKRDTIFINNSFTNNGCILRNIQPIIINNSSTLLLTPITGCDSVVYNNTFFKRDTTLFAQAQNPQGCILYLQQPIHIYNSEIVTLSQLSACDSLLYNSVMYYKDTIIKTFDTTLQGCIKTILQPLVIRYLNIDITGVPALNCNTRTTTLTATANGYPYTGSFNALYYWLNQVNGAQNTISTAGIYTIRIRSPFCLKEKSIEVIDAPPLTANVSLTDAICHNDPVTLTAINITNAIPLGSTRYQLDNNLPITDSIFTNMQAGWHTIKVSDARNCVWSSSLYVSNPSLITLDLGNDKTIHLGDTIRFNPQLNSYTSVSYAWSSSFGMPLYLSCDNCRRPVAIPLQNITYTATVTDANGCKITDNIDINIIDDYEVYIPNVFTPNNDGKNDLFTAYGGRSVSNIALMQIFDRWGVLIYEAKNLPINSNDYKNAWDGTYKDTELNPAVFVYSIKIKFINGFERIYTGDIMLVR